MNASPITDPMLSIVRTLMEENAAKGETFISLRLDIIAEMVARIDACEPNSNGVLQSYLNAKGLCTDYDHGRGIWKRIAENRELLLCLQEHGADFMERCCWVERFFYSQDVFLVSLVNALYLTKPVWMPPSFPQKWPGKELDPAEEYLHFAPAIAESVTVPTCDDSTGKDVANHASDADHKLASIMYLCTQTSGSRGIWKRIDENRELLECIQKYAPEFLERCGWICNWIGCQDAFLLALKKLLSLPSSPFPAPEIFPRPWSDCADFDSLGLSEDWVETCCKKVGRSDGEQSKGKQ